MARLRAAWGLDRVKRMLPLAETIDADQALACGFLHRICAADELDAAAASLCEKLTSLAPFTQAVAKETLRRLTHARLPDGDDLVRESYGSQDFKEGVDAFLTKREPHWKGE